MITCVFLQGDSAKEVGRDDQGRKAVEEVGGQTTNGAGTETSNSANSMSEVSSFLFNSFLQLYFQFPEGIHGLIHSSVKHHIRV